MSEEDSNATPKLQSRLQSQQ